MNFLIEHQCPQCGAPAVLSESDRLFSCEYCRVRSYLLSGKYFRYLFPHKAEPQQDIIYFPYWRFKGMVFTCTLSGVTHRFVDASHQAFPSSLFPVSVGLRSQALKLRFAVKEIPGAYIRPTLSMDHTMTLIEERMDLDRRDTVLYRAYIGENLSLIYAPFYMKEKLHDAILNTPLAVNADGAALAGLPVEKPSWRVTFVPTLCPACGWDLNGDKDSLALGCGNCQTVWQTTPKGLLNLKFGRIPGKTEDTVYLPFWRIRTELSGIQIDSYADLVRQANLPKVVQPHMHEIPFYFWVQAFKIRPRAFLQVARHITLSQPLQTHVETLPSFEKMHPVTLPVTEAVESLKLLLAEMVRPAKKVIPKLPEIRIKPIRFKLVYVPFEVGHHEYIQPDVPLTINKNMLALAKNL